MSLSCLRRLLVSSQQQRTESKLQRASAGLWVGLVAEPSLDRAHDVRLFVFRERTASLYTMPLRQTPPTTSRRRVLCDEYGVPFERRLLAIVPRRGRCQSLRHETFSVSENGRQPLFFEVGFLFLPQSETLSKG
jgi:hypothetical protein